jgi:hypothetical protein
METITQVIMRGGTLDSRAWMGEARHASGRKAIWRNLLIVYPINLDRAYRGKRNYLSPKASTFRGHDGRNV